eukprot:5507519-Amphidinium_carterae.1
MLQRGVCNLKQSKKILKQHGTESWNSLAPTQNLEAATQAVPSVPVGRRRASQVFEDFTPSHTKQFKMAFE